MDDVGVGSDVTAVIVAGGTTESPTAAGMVVLATILVPAASESIAATTAEPEMEFLSVTTAVTVVTCVGAKLVTSWVAVTTSNADIV